MISRKLFLPVVLLALTAGSRASQKWPVQGNIDISSNFGEYRLNRFHAGVDIRTGGKIGVRIYSPVDGYIWRIKMSYAGYGKGLYVKGDDGYFYVYGHLDDVAQKIDRIIKNLQTASQRYYQDVYFPKDSIRVAAGDFLGYSGRTGAKAPHLHFEKRTPDNYPVNPLRYGFELKDSQKPVFSWIIFRMTDDKSLFHNGTRSLELNAVGSDGASIYRIDTVLYFNRPFGILTECYDRTRAGGMHLTPYSLALYVDDTLQYEVTFDTVDFDAQRSVNLEYDLVRAAEGNKDVRRLYHMTGNDYNGSRAITSDGGIIGASGDLAFGRHRGKIVATDHRGNSSMLSFGFVWGPPEDLYVLDKTSPISPEPLVFDFSPSGGKLALPVDSIAVSEYAEGQWEFLPDVETTRTSDGGVRCALYSRPARNAVMRLVAFHKDVAINDVIFDGSAERIESDIALTYEIVEDGLELAVHSEAANLLRPRVEFYRSDSLLGVKHLRPVDAHRYVGFIPPESRYAQVDRISCFASDESDAAAVDLPVNIFLVGAGPNETIMIAERYTLHLGKENLYQPRFIELKTDSNRPGYLQILPEAFICRADYELLIDRPVKAGPPQPEGVCWFNENDKEWIWLDNQPATNSMGSAVTGGGVFQILVDEERPDITQLSVTNGLTYFNPQHEISFLLTDTLSGFADDRNILIELDGRWMIPEYNPDTKICKTYPVEPLPDGRHELRIVGTDRAGNVTEQKLHFFVKKQ